ncbi:hypothetical protein OHD62_17420 [Mesorhizobium sp. YC-39]|uniref:hypothetical protein n=1 Tax=unclassified Mesorhizobium TaxID=325217 RepID=UPI0021E6E4C8|nr:MULTISPECIES: hypothetical protein [unclassified Mesorhizobium]MCV3209624.1 hypothetical protein [Mesorhizobium sp. YC-2]MCV3230154.1 hypothetical protein [Mesorhizobium sp. YC-39]
MNKFDEMLRRDDLWFQIAVIVAVLVFFSVAIGTLIALFAGDTAAIGIRIDIVYKLGLIGAGLITFCTVVWRGLLATQQVDAQRKQLDKLSAQIAVTEENNLATLLQKGAELLADAKPGYANAGIATLQAVITSPNPKFSIEAMNLVADFIQSEFPESHRSAVFQAASGALYAGAKLGRRAGRSLTFSYPEDDVATLSDAWLPVFGVRRVVYQRGRIDPDTFWSQEKDSKTKWMFNDLNVSFGKVGVLDNSFSRCTFVACEIKRVYKKLFTSHTFENCNFSNSVFEGKYELGDLRESGNYFIKGEEPRAENEVDWLSVFLETELEDEIPF